jgi:hypothetical protein
VIAAAGCGAQPRARTYCLYVEVCWRISALGTQLLDFPNYVRWMLLDRLWRGLLPIRYSRRADLLRSEGLVRE